MIFFSGGCHLLQHFRYLSCCIQWDFLHMKSCIFELKGEISWLFERHGCKRCGSISYPPPYDFLVGVIQQKFWHPSKMELLWKPCTTMCRWFFVQCSFAGKNTTCLTVYLTQKRKSKYLPNWEKLMVLLWTFLNISLQLLNGSGVMRSLFVVTGGNWLKDRCNDRYIANTTEVLLVIDI